MWCDMLHCWLSARSSNVVRSLCFMLFDDTVAGLSSIISIPFVILALVSGFPACFLYFIPSGLVRRKY